MSVKQIKKVSKQLGGSTDLFLNIPTIKIRGSDMQFSTNYEKDRSTNTLINELIKKLRPHHFNRWLNVVYTNQGITTDNLSKHGLKSNNHHDASQHLNEQLIPLGWVIAKFPTEKRQKSWRWYLIPVKKALTLGIDQRLRRKIFRLLEASNDE
jgi:hypothetical protein